MLQSPRHEICRSHDIRSIDNDRYAITAEYCAAQFSPLKRAGKKQNLEWFKDPSKDKNNFVESHPKKN